MRYRIALLLFAVLAFPAAAHATETSSTPTGTVRVATPTPDPYIPVISAPKRTKPRIVKVLQTMPTSATYRGRANGVRVRRGGKVIAEWYRGNKVRISWGPYRHRWVSKKAFERPWKSGTCSWYDIADNTPPGSRATSSGKRLGWGGGWTFASLHFSLGTVLLIKGRNGRVHKATCTDRGGLRTIDLYRPAYKRFGNSDRFKYVVVRRGW